MNIPEDFKEFIVLLNEHQVEYLIVGGYAVAFHSQPKFTQDIDFWIRNNNINVNKFLFALTEFGFNDLKLSADDLREPDIILQLGVPPMRIDIFSGLSFNDAYEHRIQESYMGESANFISLSDLVKNKKASGREKDMQDIRWLERYGNLENEDNNT